MMRFQNERERFDLMEKLLYTPVICDILDDLGYRNQIASMRIRPLERNFVVAGRAKTILAADLNQMPERPYASEIEAVDSLQENEVVAVDTNRSTGCAFWGELLSTAAIARGARGALVYGAIRDVKKILDTGFKVFTSDLSPLDSKGRQIVVRYDCPIDMGGVIVQPGDILFADYDGIVAIPKAVEDQVIDAALEKVQKEKQSIQMLREGAYLRDVYDRFGIL